MERRMERAIHIHIHIYIRIHTNACENERRRSPRYRGDPVGSPPRFLGLKKRRGAAGGGHSTRATPLNPDSIPYVREGGGGGGKARDD